MRIYKTQIETLSRFELEKFTNQMHAHLMQFFPERCEQMSAQAFGKFIERGLQRARQYDILANRDLAGYIDLMLLLGENFDVDSSIPWAGEVLNRKAPSRERIVKILDIVAGDDK